MFIFGIPFFNLNIIEIISARGPVRTDNILKIVNEDHREVDVVNPGCRAEITLGSDASPNDIIRKVPR